VSPPLLAPTLRWLLSLSLAGGFKYFPFFKKLSKYSYPSYESVLNVTAAVIQTPCKKSRYLEAISKLSFGPISLLVPRFKSSKYYSIPPV